MNVRLLRRIAKVIQEKPREFDMRTFHNQKDCGTTHCIGGWAEALTGKNPIEALGLTGDESDRLFYVQIKNHEWPKRFLGRKRKNMTWREYVWLPTARQAAARIEHFIKTKGAE